MRDRTFHVCMAASGLAALFILAFFVHILERKHIFSPEAPEPIKATGHSDGWTSSPTLNVHWDIAYSKLDQGLTNDIAQWQLKDGKTQFNNVTIEWVAKFPLGATNQIQIGLVNGGGVVWRKRPHDFKHYEKEP